MNCKLKFVKISEVFEGLALAYFWWHQTKQDDSQWKGMFIQSVGYLCAAYFCCIVKALCAFKTFKNSDAVNPFEPLMKSYKWTVLYKTIILGAYISAVNFYNCPFEITINACLAIE